MQYPSPSRRCGAVSRRGLGALVFAGALVLTLVWIFKALGENDSGTHAAGSEGVMREEGAVHLSGDDQALNASELADEDWAPVSAVRAGVRLHGPGILAGTVLERSVAGPGVGVAGVSVYLIPVPPSTAGMLGRMLDLAGVGNNVSSRVSPIATAVTDAFGNFLFEGVRTGNWFVDCVGDYHVAESPVRARVLASGEGGPIDVYVRAGGRVLGRVQHDDGRPVKSATVMVAPGPAIFITAAGRGEMHVHETKTDEEGRFFFPAVAPAEGYEVSAVGQSFALTHILGLNVVAGQDTEVLVTARRGATIEGVVLSAGEVNEDGEEAAPVPLAGAKVGIVPRGLRHMRYAREILERTHAVTDENGRYIMRGVPNGEVDVLAMAPHHIPAKGPMVRASEGGQHMAAEFVLLRGPEVSGIVTDVTGQPLSNVRVRWPLVDFSEFQGGFSFAPLLAQAMKEFDFPHSDSEGRFSAGPFPGDPDFNLQFYRPGYQDAKFAWNPERDGAEISVVMYGGGSVEGIVIDEEKLEPVTTFQVQSLGRIEMQADAPGNRNPFTGGETLETTDGRFRIDNLPPGTSELTFRAEGYVDTLIESVEVTEGSVTKGLIVKLSPGGRIHGVVVDVDGAPVPGVQIATDGMISGAAGRLDASQSQGGGGVGRPPMPRRNRLARPGPLLGFVRFAANLGLLGDGVATTDSEGHFELSGLAVGTHEVIAVHRDFKTASQKVILEADALSTEVQFELSQGGGLHGRVTDRFDRPMEEAIVVAMSPGALGGERAGGSIFQGRTDAQGEYRIENMDPGGYFLVLTRGDETLNPMSFFGSINFGMITIPGDAMVRYDIVDSSAGACRVFGTVTSKSEPATRGGIVAMGFESDNLLGVDVKMTTIKENGEYEFSGLPPGEYRFQVDGAGPRTRIWVEIPDQPEYHLDLPLPEASISGVVIDDATGLPVQHAEVSIVAGRTVEPTSLFGRMLDDGGRRGNGTRVRTDEDGAFRFESLQEGDFELFVQGPRRGSAKGDYAPAGSQALELHVNEELRNLEVRLPAAVRLTGRVTDPDGGPIAGAEVIARLTKNSAGSVETDRTDEDGRFDIGGLTPGTHIVRASAEGFADRAVRDIDVDESGGELDLTLERGIEVNVRVFDEDGSPAAGATARLMPLGDVPQAGDSVGNALRSFFSGKTTTDADGRMALGQFGPGEYRLEVALGSRQQADEVTLDAGQLEILLRVTLR